MYTYILMNILSLISTRCIRDVYVCNILFIQWCTYRVCVCFYVLKCKIAWIFSYYLYTFGEVHQLKRVYALNLNISVSAAKQQKLTRIPSVTASEVGNTKSKFKQILICVYLHKPDDRIRFFPLLFLIFLFLRTHTHTCVAYIYVVNKCWKDGIVAWHT